MLIRVLVGAALGTALLACVAVPIPDDLPAIALGQAGLYRLEIALLIFYSWLLLVTPAFSGLIRGRLPIEISTRGARFAEEAGQSAALNVQRIEKLERIAEAHDEELVTAKVEIKRLHGMSERDSTKPTVGSKR